jgi:hypothetical protein
MAKDDHGIQGQTDYKGPEHSVEARGFQGRRNMEDSPDTKLESTSANEQHLQDS